MKNGFGDDGKGDDAAQLQSYDGDDWNERVFQGVLKVHRAFTQTARSGKFNEVGAQNFQHLGPHQPHDERQLKHRQCQGRQY